MAINWDFDATVEVSDGFELIPVGDYRIRVSSIEEKVSKSGNDMFEIVFDVSGFNSRLYYYLVLMPSNPTLTNQKLKEFCLCFNIPQTLSSISNSKGAVGGARVKHEDYNGSPSAKVHYFILGDKQDKLGPWVEPGNSGGTIIQNDIDDDDVPF